MLQKVYHDYQIIAKNAKPIFDFFRDGKLDKNDETEGILYWGICNEEEFLKRFSYDFGV